MRKNANEMWLGMLVYEQWWKSTKDAGEMQHEMPMKACEFLGKCYLKN